MWYVKVWDVVDEGFTEYGPFETYEQANNFVNTFESWEIFQK